MLVSEAYNSFLIEFINKFIKENDKLPTRKDLENNGVAVDLILKSYGDLKRAFSQLGFEEYISDDISNAKEIVSNYVKNNGTFPTIMQAKKEGVKTMKVLCNFSNWTKFKNHLLQEDNSLLEIIKNKEENAINQEKENLIEIIKNTSSIPTLSELKDLNISIKSLLKKFGSYRKIIEVFDLKEVLNQTLESKLNQDSTDLKNFILNNGRIPNEEEFENLGLDLNSIKKLYKNKDNFIENFLNQNKELKEMLEKEKEIKIQTEADKLIALTKQKEEMPTIKEAQEHNINVNLLIKEFDNYSNVKYHFRLDEIVDDIVKNKILNIQKRTITTPLLSQLKNANIGIEKVIRKYGNYRNALLCLRIPDFNEDVVRNIFIEEINSNNKIPKFRNLKESYPMLNKIVNKIGGFNALKNTLNIDSYYKNYLSDKIISLYEEKEKGLTIKDLKENNINIKYLKTSWLNLRKSLGIPDSREKYNKKDIDNILYKIKAYYNNGNKVTVENLKKEGINIALLVNRFKTFSNVLEECDIPLNRSLSNKEFEEISSQICDYYNENKKPPTINQLREKGFRIDSAIRKFKNYKNILSKLNIKKGNNFIESQTLVS